MPTENQAAVEAMTDAADDFIQHVNTPVPEGHGFTMGEGAPIVDLGPTRAYHDHLHATRDCGHGHG